MTPNTRRPFAIVAATTLLAATATAGAQTSEGQSDWSGGVGQPGPVPAWADKFESANNVAWRSIAGQISLASNGRFNAVQHGIRADGELSRCIAAGDIDGDLDDDLVTCDPVTDVFQRKGAIYWWWRRAEGDWRRRLISDDFYGARFVNTADVDLDGDQDVIAAAYYGDAGGLGRNGRFAWFENLDGDGESWEHHLVGDYFWGANHIDAGDFDGDGDIDLTGASELTDGIYEQDGDIVWFENVDGAGDSWELHDIDVNFPNASHAEAIDLDRDGDLDIAAANSNPFGRSHLYWWENDLGDGSVWTKRELPGEFDGAGYLAVGDVDDDGDVDLVGGGLHTSELLWWENLDGEGTQWAVRFVGILPGGQIVRLRDVNGDGDLDAVTAGNNNLLWGGFWWFENDLAGTGEWNLFQVKFNSGRHPWLALGDVNGDGRIDLAASVEDPYENEDLDISWWDLSDFASGGDLTSSILDGGDDPRWNCIEWDANVRGDSVLIVEVRAGDDPGDLGDFVIAPQSGAVLSDLINPSARYFQYRLSLTKGGDEAAPIVREIHVGPTGSTGLHLTPPAPGDVGETNRMRATYPESGVDVIFAYSLLRGTTTVPGCSGVSLSLANAQLVDRATTNASGEAIATFFVPPVASGRTVHFQALVRERCTQSDVVSHTFN